MTLNHLGEFLIWLYALPLQTGLPVVEETACPALAFVVPQLPERLLEQVGSVESFVGSQQRLQRLAAFHREVLAVTKQDVLLAFDVAPLIPLQAGVFILAY